jgi:enamine deaminase RidA (YjgF/YER057c/UK114 family)
VLVLLEPVYARYALREGAAKVKLIDAVIVGESMSAIEARLKEFGVILPPPRPVPANFVPATVLGEICWLSGTIGTVVNERGEHVVLTPGRLGREVTLEQGYACARQCVINHLAWLKQALGDLDRLQRVLKLTGYVNAVDGYKQAPQVVNGASDFLVELFGPERGAHSRVAISIAGIAFDAPVLTEMVLQVKP